jgi:NAD(P) transhydrogenase subunit alpha
MAADASRLYAKNVANFIELLVPREPGDGGEIRPDFNDEVVAGACLTHAGEVRHEPTAEALAALAATAPAAAGAPVAAGTVRRDRPPVEADETEEGAG